MAESARVTSVSSASLLREEGGVDHGQHLASSQGKYSQGKLSGEIVPGSSEGRWPGSSTGRTGSTCQPAPLRPPLHFMPVVGSVEKLCS